MFPPDLFSLASGRTPETFTLTGVDLVLAGAFAILLVLARFL